MSADEIRHELMISHLAFERQRSFFLPSWVFVTRNSPTRWVHDDSDSFIIQWACKLAFVFACLRVCFVHAILTALNCYCRISNGTHCWADGSVKVDVRKIITRTKTSSDSSDSSSTSVNKRVKIFRTKQGQQFLTSLYLKYDWSQIIPRGTLKSCWSRFCKTT